MNDRQLINDLEYIYEKLSLIPAFGDTIGEKVNKAELGITLNKLRRAIDQLQHTNPTNP